MPGNKRKNVRKPSTASKKAKRSFEEEECEPSRTFVAHEKGDMKFVCFNVNGIRAAAKKNLADFLKDEDADFVCFSEMKCFEADNPLTKKFKEMGYRTFWGHCEKAGYAGSGILSKKEPLSVVHGIDSSCDDEGRAITLEFETFYLINTYVPNSGEKLKFKTRRLDWDTKMKAHLEKLQAKKNVIWTGDLNVAIQDFDVYDGEYNKQRAKSPGFTPYERENMNNMVADLSLVDVFRSYFPTKKNTFTFFSYRGNMRPTNRGWRLDYFMVSKGLKDLVKSIEVRKDRKMSDHLPLVLSMKDPAGAAVEQTLTE